MKVASVEPRHREVKGGEGKPDTMTLESETVTLAAVDATATDEDQEGYKRVAVAQLTINNVEALGMFQADHEFMVGFQEVLPETPPGTGSDEAGTGDAAATAAATKP
jgi:hypothetical protein